MIGSKLTQILKTFSTEEFKNFEKFVVSPYFNTGRNAEGLYSIIKPYYPDFISPELDRKLVFKKLFPGDKFNEMKFKNVATALTRLAEQFMVNEGIKNDPVEFERRLIDSYSERLNLKLYYNASNSLEKKIDKLPFDHHKGFSVEESIAAYKYSYYLKMSRHDKAIPLVSKAAEYNILTFLVKYIKSINYINRIPGTYYKETKNDLVESLRVNLDLDEIVKDLRKRKYPYLWLIELYYYTFKFFQDLDDTDAFRKARKSFNENKNKYSRIEKHFILGNFYSYCINKFSAGNTDFIREEFEICKQFKEEKALTSTDNVALELMSYRNILYTAIKVKEFDWLENFINDCTPLLHEEHRESMMNFALARLEFEKKQFEKALEYASVIRYDSFTYKLDVKNLLLLTYYELELFDQAESLIQTYRHYVKHNKDFSRAYMVKFKNFIDIYSGLFKARSTGNRKDMDLLLKKAESMDILPSSAWFKAKLKELQK